MPKGLMSHLFFLLKSNPEISDAWGYHIRAIHYYEPLPDFKKLTAEQLQRKRVSSAIDFNFAKQVELLGQLGDASGGEISLLSGKPEPEGFDFKNLFFSGLDAAAYYALIRKLKPAKVIEIGSGYSTQIASKALGLNRIEGETGKLISIEPYPEARLTESGAEFTLVKKRIQDVDIGIFEALEENDILLVIAGATIGRIGIVNKEALPANTNQAVCFIRPENIFPEYLLMWMQTSYINSQVWLNATKAAQPNLAMGKISSFKILYPPIEEQKQIVERIKTETATIDTAIAKAEREIELIKEYKEAMISEAVMGKRKITDGNQFPSVKRNN